MTARVKMIAGLICCVVLVWGCGARWVRQPVVEQQHLEVSLEHKVVDGEMADQQFNHPFDVDEEKIRALLDQLQYLQKPLIYGDAKRLPVFQQVEIKQLAPALADAVGRASKKQRVRFISYNTGGGLLFKKQRRTGGVLFVDGSDQLNLAFSYVNYEIKDEELKRGATEQLYTDPLSVDSSDRPVLTPGAAVGHRIKNGKEMPLWLVADIDRLDADRSRRGEPAVSKDQPPEAAQPSEMAEEAPVAPAAEPRDRGEKIEAESEAKPKPEPEVQSKPAAKPGPAVSPDAPEEQWERQKADIREKLKYLKELRKSDLIDEKEYEAQKEKLLEQITAIPGS